MGRVSQVSAVLAVGASAIACSASVVCVIDEGLIVISFVRFR